MCGISGAYSPSRDYRIDDDALRAMANRLAHRGPDDFGCFIDGGIGLAFSRLAIVDLATGNQPHSNEDGSITSICNGEIYNFKELRHDLEGRGHRFRTQCDVEVVVHLYEEYGADCVRHLNGQFAVAVYDRKRHALLLARDQVGIAPLFYTWVGNGNDRVLLFASEIKALLTHSAVQRTVDLRGLDQVLTFPGLISPTTLFADVRAMPPGHYLHLGADGAATPRCYWDLDYPEQDAGPAPQPESFYVQGIENRLLAAVRRRLNADVPVGFYLSGGLDSSLIGALSQAVRPQQRFHSFSITFPQSDIDERYHQRVMADHLGTVHHEAEFTSGEIVSRLRQAVVCAEAPLKESYDTCSLALSALVHDSGHKVVLTGEGADELFAGYVGYRLQATAGRSADPDDIETMLENELREQMWGDSSFFYERDYLAFRDIKTSLYSEAVASRLPDFDCTRHALVDTGKLRNRHPVHQRSYVDFKLRISDHLLADHGDRVAYANSVEARYPFLDLDLIDFCRTIPPGLMIKDSIEKHLLRRVAERYLPPSIAGREKFAFVAPGSQYLLARNEGWINDLLSPERLRRQNYFNPDTVERLRRRAREGGSSINTTFELDLLMIVLTFSILIDVFELPAYTA